MDFARALYLIMAAFLVQSCSKPTPSAPIQEIVAPSASSLAANTLWLQDAAQTPQTIALGSAPDDARVIYFVGPDPTIETASATKIVKRDFSILRFELPQQFGIQRVSVLLADGAHAKNTLDKNDAVVTVRARHGDETVELGAGQHFWSQESLVIHFDEPPFNIADRLPSPTIAGTLDASLCESRAAASVQCDDPGAFHLHLRMSFKLSVTNSNTEYLSAADPRSFDFANFGSTTNAMDLGTTPNSRNNLSVAAGGTSYFRFTGKKNVRYQIMATPITGDGNAKLSANVHVNISSIDSVGNSKSLTHLSDISGSTQPCPTNSTECIIVADEDLTTKNNPAISQPATGFLVAVGSDIDTRIALKIVDNNNYSNITNVVYGGKVNGLNLYQGAASADPNVFRNSTVNIGAGGYFRARLNQSTNNSRIWIYDSSYGGSEYKLLCSVSNIADTNVACEFNLTSVTSQIYVTAKTLSAPYGSAFEYSIERISTATVYENVGLQDPVPIPTDGTPINTTVGAQFSVYSIDTTVGKTYTVDVSMANQPLRAMVVDIDKHLLISECYKFSNQNNCRLAFTAANASSRLYVTPFGPSENSLFRGTNFVVSATASGLAFQNEGTIGINTATLATNVNPKTLSVAGRFSYPQGQLNSLSTYAFNINPYTSPNHAYRVSLTPVDGVPLSVEVFESSLGSKTLCKHTPAPGLSAACSFNLVNAGIVTVAVTSSRVGGGRFQLHLSNEGTPLPVPKTELIDMPLTVAGEPLTFDTSFNDAVGLYAIKQYSFSPQSMRTYSITVSPRNSLTGMRVYQHPYQYPLPCVDYYAGMMSPRCAIRVTTNLEPIRVQVYSHANAPSGSLFDFAIKTE